MSVFFPSLMVALLALTGVTLLVTRSWRWSIGALIIQYIGVVFLVAQELPLGLAVIKLVVGWMAAVVLGLTELEQKAMDDSKPSGLSGQVFRLLAAALILLIILSISPKVGNWFPGISVSTIQAGLVLIGLGLLQLGMTSRPFQVSLGLLTLLAGFEVLYAGVEFSILVAGLLAVVNLGLALAGSYLILMARSGEAS